MVEKLQIKNFLMVKSIMKKIKKKKGGGEEKNKIKWK